VNSAKKKKKKKKFNMHKGAYLCPVCFSRSWPFASGSIFPFSSLQVKENSRRFGIICVRNLSSAMKYFNLPLMNHEEFRVTEMHGICKTMKECIYSNTFDPIWKDDTVKHFQTN
jgi:hypothetical protein